MGRDDRAAVAGSIWRGVARDLAARAAGDRVALDLSRAQGWNFAVRCGAAVSCAGCRALSSRCPKPSRCSARSHRRSLAQRWSVSVSDPATSSRCRCRKAARDAFVRPRSRGALLVTIDGVVVMIVERRGERIMIRPDSADAAVTERPVRWLRIVARLVATSPWRPSPMASRRASKYLDAFLAAGFNRGTAGLRYYRKSNYDSSHCRTHTCPRRRCFWADGRCKRRGVPTPHELPPTCTVWDSARARRAGQPVTFSLDVDRLTEARIERASVQRVHSA